MAVTALIWDSLEDARTLNATQLAQLKTWGFDGIVCILGGNQGANGLSYGPAAGSSSEWGGSDAWGPSSTANFGTAAKFTQQRAVGQAGGGTNFTDKAHTAGLKVYLGFYLENNNVRHAPCTGDWFSSSWIDWEQTAQDIAAGAAWAGFDGLAFDTEGDGAITWQYNYTGNSNSQASTKSQAQTDGAAMASSIVTGFGGQCPIVMYQSIISGGMFSNGYYDNFASYQFSEFGTTLPASATATFTSFVTGLASNITAPIICGNAVFYDYVNVAGNQGPYGHAGDTPVQCYTNALADEATAMTDLGIANVYAVPFVWPADNTDSPGGQWSQTMWNNAAPTIRQNCQHSTFIVYQQAGLTAINWANYTGASFSNVNYTPVDGGSGGGGVITHVQDVGNAGATFSTNTATITISSTASGDLLVLAFANSFNNVINVVSVTDNKSQTWTLANQENDDATIADMEVWQFPNTASGVTTVTVTVTVGQLASHCAYNVSEWSGVATTSPLDGHPAGSTGTAATALAPSITPAVANELFIGIIGTQNASFTGTAGAGFTALTWSDPAGANNTRSGYLIASDSSAHALSWGLTGSDNYAGTAASFEPTSGASLVVTGTLSATATLTGDTETTAPATGTLGGTAVLTGVLQVIPPGGAGNYGLQGFPNSTKFGEWLLNGFH